MCGVEKCVKCTGSSGQCEECVHEYEVTGEGGARTECVTEEEAKRLEEEAERLELGKQDGDERVVMSTLSLCRRRITTSY